MRLGLAAIIAAGSSLLAGCAQPGAPYLMVGFIFVNGCETVAEAEFWLELESGVNHTENVPFQKPAGAKSWAAEMTAGVHRFKVGEMEANQTVDTTLEVTSKRRSVNVVLTCYPEHRYGPNLDVFIDLVLWAAPLPERRALATEDSAQPHELSGFTE